MILDAINRGISSVRDYLSRRVVVQWQHESWRYIDHGRTPNYDGSFLVRRTDEETAAALPTLIDLVRERHIHAIKYMTNADHSAAGFSNLKPPILFYCRKQERDNVKQVLENNGFPDAEWRTDNRTSFQLAKWGVNE